MRTLRLILLTTLASALLCATSYAAGQAWQHRHELPDLPFAVPAAAPAADADAPPPTDAGPRAHTERPVERQPWKRAQAQRDRIGPADVLRPGPTLLRAGDVGEEVRDLQARLKSIRWISGEVTGTFDSGTVEAVRGFQRKREIPVTGEVDRRTLERLHAMTVVPSHEAKHNIVPTGALDPRCLTGRALCVDKSTRLLSWVVDGVVLDTLEVRFGSAELPTREGAFSVRSKSRDHVSSIYGTSMPFAMFFSGGQAVHYSPDFAAVGYAGASHGCVNVRDYDGIAALYDQVQVGDRVIVHRS